MIHRNKIFTNFATSNKDYPVHSSSGLGRRLSRRKLGFEPRTHYKKLAVHLRAFSFSGYEQTCLVLIQVDHATSRFISTTIY